MFDPLFYIPNLASKSKVSFLYFSFPANLSNIKIVRYVPSEWLCNTWRIENCAKLGNMCPQTVKLEEMEKKAGNAEGDVSSLRFEITFINCLFPEHNSFFWKFPIEFFHLMTFGHIWITAGEAFDDQDCSELYVQVPPYPASGEQWETRRPPRKG